MRRRTHVQAGNALGPIQNNTSSYSLTWMKTAPVWRIRED